MRVLRLRTVERWLDDPSVLIARRAVASVAGLILVVLGIGAALALASWTVTDPSFTHATSAQVQNWMGTVGAAFADPAMQVFGLAAPLLIAPFALWGTRLIAGRPLGVTPSRVAAGFGALVLLPGLLEVLPATESWPLPLGLGGVVGAAHALLWAGFTGSESSTLRVIAGGLTGLGALVLLWHACAPQRRIAPLPELGYQLKRAAPAQEADEEEDEYGLDETDTFEREPSRLAAFAGGMMHTAFVLKRRIRRSTQRGEERPTLRSVLERAEPAHASERHNQRDVYRTRRSPGAAQLPPAEEDDWDLDEPVHGEPVHGEPVRVGSRRDDPDDPAFEDRALYGRSLEDDGAEHDGRERRERRPRSVQAPLAAVDDRMHAFRLTSRGPAARLREALFAAFEPAGKPHEEDRDEDDTSRRSRRRRESFDPSEIAGEAEDRFEDDEFDDDRLEDDELEDERDRRAAARRRTDRDEHARYSEDDDDDEDLDDVRDAEDDAEDGGFEYPYAEEAARRSAASARSQPSKVAARPSGGHDQRVQPSAAPMREGSRARQGSRPMVPIAAYVTPPLNLLTAPSSDRGDTRVTAEALEANARDLEGVLDDFGVRGQIVHVRPGPVVTLYELEPAPGIKSSRVIGLADDIARSMSAISARVAVIPGKNAIGIELPNQRRVTVFLRELLASEAFERTRAKLPLCLGKTIGGEAVIADLAGMPHLLVAGTTGSGKSVSINTMLLSLLYHHTPEACRLIMIDPKKLELAAYDGIPHLLTPVVTDPKKAVTALKWAVREMEDRYEKMAKLGVRNLSGFNTRLAEARRTGERLTRIVQTGFDKATGEAIFEEEVFELEPMPYIVVIVDEMADLMLVAGKDIEGTIQRLAQMARAAGIHLIMATQRPSVDVITGTIKANFPTRISFQVTSKIDSRTILGEMGAEQLLGMGDMLYMERGGKVQRVHGPFVSDEEVEDVVAHLKAQGTPDYLMEVFEGDDDGEMAGGGGAGLEALSESDDLYDRAVALVLRDRKASTSYVQRRLSIGYNRAATLIERMEREGVVSPANHAGKRDILVPREAGEEAA